VKRALALIAGNPPKILIVSCYRLADTSKLAFYCTVTSLKKNK